MICKKETFVFVWNLNCICQNGIINISIFVEFSSIAVENICQTDPKNVTLLTGGPN